MRIFAESFFVEALQVNLACARPFPLLYKLDLTRVGGLPLDVPDCKVPDFVCLRELRAAVQEEDVNDGIRHGPTEPAFLAKVPAEILERIPLSALRDGHDSHGDAAAQEFFPKAPPELGSRLGFGVQGLGHVRPPYFRPRRLVETKRYFSKQMFVSSRRDGHFERYRSSCWILLCTPKHSIPLRRSLKKSKKHAARVSVSLKTTNTPTILA